MSSPACQRFLQKLKVKKIWIREFLAEFFGTFILVIFGDGVLATSILEGNGVTDPFGATWAWGVGIILGIAASGGVSGGHINPGVSVAFASVGKLPWWKVPHYLLAQHLGGFFAAVFLYVTYYEAFHVYDPNLTVSGNTRTAWVFSTYPRDDIAIWNCFVGEVVAGTLLMFSLSAIVDPKNLNIPKFLYPIFIGLDVQVTLQAFGMNCMAPINPARDFATRIFALIAGWGSETFSYRNSAYWWIGIVGPHIGCVIGAWLYLLAIELHWPGQEDEASDSTNMTVTTMSKDEEE